MTLSIQDAIQEEIVTITAPQFDELNAKLDRLIELQIQSQETSTDALINASQVAAMFNVNVVTVRNWVKAKKLKCIRVDGNGKMMFSKEMIRKYQNG